MANFEQQLKELINKCGIENCSDTPDYILANYINACLGVYTTTVRARDKWFGFVPWEKGEVHNG